MSGKTKWLFPGEDSTKARPIRDTLAVSQLQDERRIRGAVTNHGIRSPELEKEPEKDTQIEQM